MKIKKLVLDNFMLFSELDISWSSGINVISGDNSTGKTALLKAMYAILYEYARTTPDISKDEIEVRFAKKMQGVFRPDEGSIGRLVSRRRGNPGKSHICIQFDNKSCIELGFGRQSSKRVEVTLPKQEKEPRKIQPIYIPPKEIISATENFSSLYDDYHIAFEETYYDLARLLDRPLKKGANTAQQNKVLEKFESILSGKVIQRDKRFFLNMQGIGEFEMGLVSEGFRKLSTILYLISSGSLDRNAVLFWDEPETNMNPKMIRPIVEALLELARMGVQIFVTTHDYFVQQEFNFAALYPSSRGAKIDVQFVSLYKNEDNRIIAECVPELSQLSTNLIMEEFDALYDREQGLINEVH